MLTTKAAMRSGDIEVVAVNDVMPMESLSLLFERDSTHGIWHEDVSFDGNILRIGEGDKDLLRARTFPDPLGRRGRGRSRRVERQVHQPGSRRWPPRKRCQEGNRLRPGQGG